MRRTYCLYGVIGKHDILVKCSYRFESCWGLCKLDCEKWFNSLVSQYWAAITMEAWTLVAKVKRELLQMGARLENGKWTYKP